MEMIVRDDRKLVEIWLTNAEKNDPKVREGLKDIYDKYKNTKHTVAVFQSGKGDLYENTRDLLLYNRRRTAQKEVEAARAAAKAAAGIESRSAADSPTATAVGAAKKPSILAQLEEYKKEDLTRSEKKAKAAEMSL